VVKSMTGYGRESMACGDYNITIEIKSVNSRFLEVNTRFPRQFAACEDDAKKQIQALLKRGKVDIYLSYEYKNGKRPPISIDKQAAIAYYNELRDLCDLCGVAENPSLMQICGFPNVMQTVDISMEDEDLQKTVMSCLRAAADSLIGLRQQEGERLKTDLLQRVAYLEGLVGEISVLAPQVADDYRDKLTERMTKVLQDVPIDEARILQEVAIFADKSDIAEELTRLGSHIAQFRETMTSNDSIGRTLDFIVQEMNREVNTIGSKANFTAITKLVIDAKSELEKVREQVQNLE